MRPTRQQRFAAKVDKTPGFGPHGDCWRWTAAKVRGYGVIDNRKAHRLAWEYANGQGIPESMIVRHSCDNPGCVNPSHLAIGTHKDNAEDRVLRGRNGDQSKERNVGAKLSMEKVAALRAFKWDGVIKQSELGEVLGISQQLVHFIVTYKRWA